MFFSHLPEALSPLFGRIDCTLTDITAPEVTLRILDGEGALLGTKHFVGQSEVSFDIAPYLRSTLRCNLTPSTTSLVRSERMVSCSLEAVTEAETLISERLTFIPASVVATDRLLTTLPTERTLDCKGVDHLTIRADAPFNIQVAGYIRGEEVITQRFSISEAGLYDLTINAADFDRVDELALLFGGRMVADYVVRERSPRAVTLAWLSSAGSIEHYTFPRRVSLESEVERIEGYGSEGYETACIALQESLTLDTAPEPKEVIAALSELLFSPCVWQLTAEGYQPRRVVTKRLSYCDCGSLATLRVTVAANKMEERLWSC